MYIKEMKRLDGKMLISLRRGSYARNVSFRIFLQWPVHIINPLYSFYVTILIYVSSCPTYKIGASATALHHCEYHSSSKGKWEDWAKRTKTNMMPTWLYKTTLIDSPWARYLVQEKIGRARNQCKIPLKYKASRTQIVYFFRFIAWWQKITSWFVCSNLSFVTPNDLKDFEISTGCAYSTKQKNEEKGDSSSESIRIS